LNCRKGTILCALLFGYINPTAAQQSTVTIDTETDRSSVAIREQEQILMPDTVWNDPSAQYRLLEPWRIAFEFGGGMLFFNDMRGELRQGSTGAAIQIQDSEDTAGLFFVKMEIQGLVSRSKSNDWYLTTQLSYYGRSVDNPMKIRSGTHQNETVGFTLLTAINDTEVLNRNQTTMLTGIRVVSREGQLAYRAGLLTGIASRKWYEEELIWVNQLELELSYRFPDALFGPFGGLVANVGLDSDELSNIVAEAELGIRYVSDREFSLITQIDGYFYLEAGKWNDDTTRIQASETHSIIGLGGRLRVWNLLLTLKFGYILDYTFEENRSTGISGYRRRIDGSGDFAFTAALRADF